MTLSRFERDNRTIVVGGQPVAPGRRKAIELEFARLPTGGRAALPIVVLNGRKPGPEVWLSAAIHGDELNGTAIVREVMRRIDTRQLRGAILAVPIVNVLGFMNGSRYLPDRRDLNRMFPGSKRGSLGARLARLLMDEVVAPCSVGIDLHTGTNHRTNVPQIRADLDDPATRKMAFAFGTRFVVHAKVRDGSLRQAAAERGIPVLVYEGGEAHRFDADAVQAGVDGVLRTLNALDMIDVDVDLPGQEPIEVRKLQWVRARRGGIATMQVSIGDPVARGDPIGDISDATASRASVVRAPADGWVVGLSLNPLVNPGDALANIAFG